MHKWGALFIAVIVGTLGVLFVVENSGPDSGALVSTTMSSTVGVLLDEIPPSMRARVAEAIVAKPKAFWKARATRQLRLASYRLVFREAFYDPGKSSLPLPPEALWTISVKGTPTRRTIGGHDVVAVDYGFSSVLLTDVGSPGVSEPTLSKAGGVWKEPFVFPIDPEMLLQRTGYACMDESEFPFPSVDSEEIDSFYDQECDVEDSLATVGQCHSTKRPPKSCVDALADHVGAVETAVTFRRLAWDRGMANTVRLGTVTGDDPDLRPYKPEFAESRVTYRYVHASSCEAVEKSVSGTGWRRLLQFTTADENVGNRALTIGAVDYEHSGEPSELDAHNLFEFDACHGHFHFKYYGDFAWQGAGRLVNSKRGFCLQSTARTSNREGSPLHNAFAGCAYQGIEAGWVDQYKAGLPSQWLDITEFPAGRGTRSFNSNPRGFLCEGTLLDADGRALKRNQPLVWVKTALVAENGKPVEVPRCKLSTRWHANNTDRIDESIAPLGQGIITTECTRGQIGPLRNCGFGKTPSVATCVPGRRTTATFSIPKGAPPHVVRINDFSHALKSPIPARYEDSYVPLSPGASDQPSMLANAIVGGVAAKVVTFTCPSARGPEEPGGKYSIYTAPVWPDDAAASVTRT